MFPPRHPPPPVRPRFSRRAAWAAVLLVPMIAACSPSVAGPPRRVCELVVWHQPRSLGARVELRGSWDGFAWPGRNLPPVRSDGWRVTRLVLPPGPVSYALLEDGAWAPADPNVGTSAFFGEHEVALTTVPDCGVPALGVTGVSTAETGPSGARATIALSFTAAADGAALDPKTVAAQRLDDGVAVPVAVAAFSAAAGTLALRTELLTPGKHVWRVTGQDVLGRAAEPARVTLWSEPETPLVGADAPAATVTYSVNARDPRDFVIYQVMVDRFRDAQGNALPAPPTSTDRAGGQLAGLRRAVESGELSALGFNALWLAPLGRTPAAKFPDVSGLSSSAYHGYWPVAPRELEPRLGTEAELRALLASAHARGMRVLLDVVPNHVHLQHPWVAAHPNDGWFNHPRGDCICGGAQCSWGADIEDCWFTPFLPDLDWRNDAAAQAMTEDIAWWVERFGFDGVRVDAVPMMPRSATRRLAARLHAGDHPGHRTYLIGENFVGPAGFEDLRYYLGPFGLDGEFHFPLLWTLRATLGEGRGSLRDLDASVQDGEDAWRGSGAVMGLTLGNHDVPRFASVASGTAEGAGPAPSVDDARAIARQALALGMLYLLPGAPVVQWGDEVALPGRGDPDNRRVLPADEALTVPQKALREAVRALGRLRACSPALRRGSYRVLSASDELLAFSRHLGEAEIIAVLQRSASMALPNLVAYLPEGAAAQWRLGLRLDYDPSGGVVARGPLALPATAEPDGLTLDSAPLSLRIYVPRGVSCVLP